MRRASQCESTASTALLILCCMACEQHEAPQGPAPEVARASEFVPSTQVIDRAWPEWPISEEESRTEEQEIAIRKEIERLGSNHAWAGVYSESGGTDTSSRLVLAPNAGFVEISEGMSGDHTRMRGRVREANGRPILVPEFWEDEFWSKERELFPLVWGTQHCIFEKLTLVWYANQLNGGIGYFSTLGWKRSDGGKISGDLTLPAPYDKLVLQQPLIAHVTRKLDRVSRDDQIVYRLEFDVGRVQGAFEGMDMYRQHTTRLYYGVTVAELADTTCVAESYDKDRFDSLIYGEEFSTRRPGGK